MTKSQLEKMYQQFNEDYLGIQVDNMDQAYKFVNYLKEVGYKPNCLKLRHSKDINTNQDCIFIVECGRIK